MRLTSLEIEVVIASGEIEDLQSELAQQHPVLAFVQAGELPHWRSRTSRHALVVVAIDADTVFVIDPAMPPPMIGVPLDDFLLAWDEMDDDHELAQVD